MDEAGDERQGHTDTWSRITEGHSAGIVSQQPEKLVKV